MLFVTEPFTDEIFALGGNDQIFISSGANDVVHGGEGDDLVFSVDQEGIASDDRLYGDEDRDGLSAGTGNDQLYGGSEDDLLTGGEGDDYLEGNEHNDILAGGAGQDVLIGGAGNDDLWGDGSWQAANTDWSNTRAGALTTLVTSYEQITGGGLSAGVNQIKGAVTNESIFHLDVMFARENKLRNRSKAMLNRSVGYTRQGRPIMVKEDKAA